MSLGSADERTIRTQRLEPTAPRLGPAGRIGASLLALGLAGALVTALRTEPDPRGFGTHQRLGLPPCAFLARTGIKCPTCGLTTSFCWMLRGRPDRAWRAHAAGVLLVPACFVLVPWLLASARAGRPRWGARSLGEPLAALTILAATIGLAAWLVDLAATPAAFRILDALGRARR